MAGDRTGIVNSRPVSRTKPPGDWIERSACADDGIDWEIFFPEKGGSSKEAKAICARCEVRLQCLNYSMLRPERYGVWGGLSERERRRLRAIAADEEDAA